MAADVALPPDSSNPCCAELKKRYLKLEEKRNALRQAVKLLEQQINKLDTDNSHLRKFCEEQKLHIQQEKEAKEKESSIRNKLEQEVHSLKAEISSYQRSDCLNNVHEDENQQLKAFVLDKEEEIKRLKDILEKEQKKAVYEKKKADSEKKKAAEAWNIVKIAKNKAEEQRSLAEIERKKAEECRVLLEQVQFEAHEVREKLNTEISKAVDAKKLVEAEKQKVNGDKKRADSETIKAEENKRLMEVERKNAFEEKVRADRLFKKLEEERQLREELQKKIEGMISAAEGRVGSCFGDGKYDGGRTIKATNLDLIRKQLKMEKRQAKHAKRAAKLAKAEKSLVMKEVHFLKHSFMQILCRFNILDGHFSESIEGIDGVAKVGRSSDIEDFKLHRNQLGSMEGNHNSQPGYGLMESCFTRSFNHPEPRRVCIGLPISRGSCAGLTAGIISEVESPIGGSVRNKSQSSAICSTTTSFTDRKLMGSQEQDSSAVTTSAKLVENTNHQSIVHKPPKGAAKTRRNRKNVVVAQSTDGSGQGEALNAFLHDAERLSDRCYKRRKIQFSAESLASLYSEYNQLHFKIGEIFSALRDLLNIEGNLPALGCSQNCGISEDLNDGAVIFNEEYGSLRRRKSSAGRNRMEDKQQTPGLHANDKIGTQMRTAELVTTSRRDRTIESFHQVRETACISQGIDDPEQQDLICFENMMRGDCMKLLDLDNDADEAKYRAAMEMPLSPTLPDVELPGFHQDGEEYSQCLSERDNSMSFVSFDVMNLEIISNTSNLKASKMPEDISLRKDHDLLHVTKETSSCLISPQSDVNQQHLLHDSSLVVSHGSPNAEQICNVRKADDDMKNICTQSSIMDLGSRCEVNPLVNCLSESNAFGNVCDETTSSATHKVITSSGTTGPISEASLYPHLLNEDENYQSGNQRMHHLARITAVDSGELVCFQPTSSRSVQNQNEGEGRATDIPTFSGGLSKMRDSEILQSQNGEKSLPAAGEVTKTSICFPLDSIEKKEAAKHAPLSSSHNIEDASNENELEYRRNPKYCVMFSDKKDEDSMMRIHCARNTLASQHLMHCQTDHMVIEALDSLAKETYLFPEEKVSVFFSLLICNICGWMSANNCTSFVQFLACADFFAVQINRALSVERSKHLFEGICQLDIFVSLVEDFLTQREVWVYTDGLHEPFSSNDLSGKSLHLNGGDTSVFSRPATVDQFVAGSIILASICTAADCIDSLLEASYSILRMCRNDISWILLALHIFASICGKKLFYLKNYHFLITALRSMVSVLEGGHKSLSSLDVQCSFPRCEVCPFASGAVCIDKFVNLLLDVLQDYNLSGLRRIHTNKEVSSPVDTMLACAERDDENASNKSLRVECNVSCCIFKSKKLAVDFSDYDFCHFTNIVSLVELVGCYMSWEWTYLNIMPRLLEMLKSCVSEEFSAALYVLIGQLGRSGIDAGGLQLQGIAELRYKLFMFFDTNITKKRSLQAQFAAVGALLNLLPLSFRDIVDEYPELELEESQSDLVKQIKDWFSQLSKDHKSLSRNLFG